MRSRHHLEVATCHRGWKEEIGCNKKIEVAIRRTEINIKRGRDLNLKPMKAEKNQQGRDQKKKVTTKSQGVETEMWSLLKTEIATCSSIRKRSPNSELRS